MFVGMIPLSRSPQKKVLDRRKEDLPYPLSGTLGNDEKGGHFVIKIH